MSTRAITTEQYHQLLGLRLLADRHEAALVSIEAAALAITGEPTAYGHTSDMIHGSRSVDELLGILNLAVSPQKEATP